MLVSASIVWILLAEAQGSTSHPSNSSISGNIRIGRNPGITANSGHGFRALWLLFTKTIVLSPL